MRLKLIASIPTVYFFCAPKFSGETGQSDLDGSGCDAFLSPRQVGGRRQHHPDHIIIGLVLSRENPQKP